MIKELVTDFFNEIEKRELKKNKNAKAIYWVEELQEVKSIEKNHISVKKATRLYNKYVEGRENIVVKEPNIYILDFMAQYLKYKDFEEYKDSKRQLKIPTKESTSNIIEPNEKLIDLYIEDKKPTKKFIIGISVLVISVFLFFAYKYNNTNSENCIVWQENHFETSSCIHKSAIDNTIYNIAIDKFKKERVNNKTKFFKNKKPLFWYGKSSEGKMEFFTHRGIHPETLKELKPVTEGIINKYVYKEEVNKTIL